MTRLLIVDDHEVVRKGLVSFLQCHPDLEVVGEAESGEEAVIKALQLNPDVVIMDIRLGEGKNGMEACREIKESNPQIRILMLTSYSDDETIFSSIMAGAHGFVVKKSRGEELVNSIRTVAKGQSIIDPSSTTKVLEYMKKASEQNAGQKTPLSAREKKILLLIAEGMSNREIAKTLTLSEKTVKNYVSIIFNKLKINNRAEAAAYAVRYRCMLK